MLTVYFLYCITVLLINLDIYSMVTCYWTQFLTSVQAA